MKFNGIDPRTLAPGISIAKEIPPGAPASSLEVIEGAEGDIVAGRTIHQAEYTVRINVGSRTRQGAWEIREKIAAWARATDTVTHELIPTHRPTRAYDAIFKAISDAEFVFGFGVIEVIFAVPRPITHALVEEYESATQQEDEEGTTLVLDVAGTSYIRPTLQLTAMECERLEVKADGKLILGLDMPLMEDDVITVQTDPPALWVTTQEAEMQPAEASIDYTVTDLHQLAKTLQPGLHMLKSQQAKRITATWRDEYL